MTIINTNTDIEFIYYVRMVDAYYEKTGRTTEVQIDTLVILYRITYSEIIFNRLFRFHYKLLNMLVYQKFRKFSILLSEEDLDDLISMSYGEFYRRVMYYTIPPEAPFSKYIKLYMRQWLNAYASLMADKNKRRSEFNEEICMYAEVILYYKPYYTNAWEDEE